MFHQNQKKVRLSQKELRHEVIEEGKSAESPLETTNKTTQLNILDQLEQQESNEKNGKSDSSVRVSNKIQAVITNLIEIDLSSSKIERSRVVVQAFFKNSRLSLNELLDNQLDGNARKKLRCTVLIVSRNRVLLSTIFEPSNQYCSNTCMKTTRVSTLIEFKTFSA